jgi:hypothetical protein
LPELENSDLSFRFEILMIQIKNMQTFLTINHWKQSLSRRLYSVLLYLEKYENMDEKKLLQQYEDFDHI